MFKALLLVATFWSPGHQVCLDKTTSPVVAWEGWFSFSKRAAPHEMIIVRECQPVSTKLDTSSDQAKFCEEADLFAGSSNFCYTTGKKTKADCENIIEQNADSYFLNGKPVYIYPN